MITDNGSAIAEWQTAVMSLLDQIALSGISAARKNLEITGHNIANAATPWFSRQEAIQSPSELFGGYTSENQVLGVNVTGVRRIFNQAIVEHCWSASSEFGFSGTYASYNTQLEAFMGDEKSNFASVFNEWISSMSQAATDPSLMAYRQQMLNASQKIVGRLNYLYERMSSLVDQVNSQINGIVAEANGLLQTVHEYNQLITHRSNGSGFDLMDDRDRTVDRLSELLGVRVFEESSGAFNISFSSGQNLVNEAQCNRLEARKRDNELFETDLYILTNRMNTIEYVYDSGGEMGGLLTFLKNDLHDTLDEIGWHALQISFATNKILKAGSDLNRNDGAELFNNMNEKRFAGFRASAQGKKGKENLFVYIDDDNLASLKSDNYRVMINLYTKDGLSIYNEKTGEKILPERVEPNKWRFNGLLLEIDNFDDAKNSDQFLIKPCRDEARLIDVKLNSAERLAFASKGNGPGDNTNVKRLLDFMLDKKLDKGTMGVAHEQMIIRIANVVSEETIRHEAIVAGRESLMNTRTGISAVDMDEEASNLVRFQHYYQANAKVLAVQKEVMESLLLI